MLTTSHRSVKPEDSPSLPNAAVGEAVHQFSALRALADIHRCAYAPQLHMGDECVSPSSVRGVGSQDWCRYFIVILIPATGVGECLKVSKKRPNKDSNNCSPY